jgi:hypothetical protein
MAENKNVHVEATGKQPAIAIRGSNVAQKP